MIVLPRFSSGNSVGCLRIPVQREGRAGRTDGITSSTIVSFYPMAETTAGKSFSKTTSFRCHLVTISRRILAICSVSVRLYYSQSEFASRWVHENPNLIFTLNCDTGRRKNSLSRSLTVNDLKSEYVQHLIF